MKSFYKIFIPFFCAIMFSITSLAQPANDNCATADSLAVYSSFSATNGTLLAATATAPTGSTCGSRRDVWYKFKVPAYTNQITITVNLMGAGNLTTANTYIELFNTNNCTVNGTTTGGCNNITTLRTFSGLTSGGIYYFRINTSVTPTSPATFNVCVTAPTASRHREIFQQTVLSGPDVLQYPWEVIYGPDNFLWITEARGYKVYKMNPNTGVKTMVLNLATGSNFLASPADTLNAVSMGTWNPWPQGGFAGMALHPRFLDASGLYNYVYVTYVHRSLGGTQPSGLFYRNKLVRFTYNTGTGLLGSPAVICDTLPGSKDHNSQRMIIAPVTPGGTKYLFLASGDMGSGQFENRTRVMRSHIPGSYEGKILRFNLDTAGGVPWIPTSNPYSPTSAVYSIGMRNNQGFAYDTALNILYGSSHGAYSDDEINIIQGFKNYGHPYVIGYADGNYNGNAATGTSTSISAGSPWGDNSGSSTCPPIGSETTRMNTIISNAATTGGYKGPMYSGYAASAANITSIWSATTTPGNNTWLSEGWSGLDLYTSTAIPGWKKSLVAAGLKWGRLIRLKLDATGTRTMPSNLDSANATDSITYFQSTNRYRDIAFSPNGKDIFVIMDNTSATSGPGVGNPTVPACAGCVIKYSFLGYADSSGYSSLPKTIPVTSNTFNTCNSGTPVTIDASNNNVWVPITGPDGNILAEINTMGQNLGAITSSVYQKSGALRTFNNKKYLNRNITITPAVTSFATPVKVRLYISRAEYDQLAADPLSQVTAINQLRVLKNDDACGGAISDNPHNVIPTNTLAGDLQHGANGYVLQVNVTSFSSFYFGASGLSLPLSLLSFNGTLQNNLTTLLKWKTTNELGTSHFIVERSTDRQSFEQVGRVAANGNTSTEANYILTDATVASLQVPDVFYRLKMFDVDGTYRYSNIIRVSLNDIKPEVTVSPNPAVTDVNASIVASENCEAEWQIVDNAGRVLVKNSISLKKGANKLGINMSQIAAGVYYLKVNGNCIDLQTQFHKL